MLVSESARLTLVVDQLEELFTDERLTPEDRRRFIGLIAGLARSGLVWVVATMRKDFWHRADETPELVRLAEGRGRLELLPPGPAQVSQMIRRPADAAGVPFEVHGTTNVPLNEVIAEEVDREPGALPLLSYLLDQLYRRDVLELRGLSLSYATYEQLGRLEGAIATQAEAVLERCLPQDRPALGSVLFALVEMNAADGSVDRAVARRVPLSAFAPGTAQRRLVDALRDRDARLLVSDAETEGTPTVRVAHEALISRWSEARNFVRGNAEALKIRRRIEERYALWRSAARAGNPPTRFGREPGLLADIDLADGQRLLREHREDTDTHLVGYIERSIADDERIRTRSTRLLAGIAAVVTLLAVIASAAGIIASRRQHDAEYQTAETLHTEARLLVEAAAQRLKDSDVAGALGIILEVLTNPDFAQRHSAAAINTFQEARAADAQLIVLSGHSDFVHAACFSPDGTHVVTASSDATARIWDASTGIPVARLSGHTDEILSAAYSPDGAHIVTGSTDKTARIWDVKTGSTIAILTGHEGAVTAVAFSPDGARIVTASNDKTARVWDARLGRQSGVLAGHGGAVLDAAFSPDGSRLVTASKDNTARIWDSRTYSQTGLLKGHEELVHSAAWSPDGRSVVTASWDKTARIWDARSGAQTAVLTGHADTLGSAAYSPDGTHIVTTATDKTARIWDAHSGAPIAVLSGHGGPVVRAVYSPDSTRIVTASWDATARIWDTRPVQQIRVLAGHGRTVFSTAFSPDGTRVLTGSQDQTAREWDARSGGAVLTLSGHADSVGSARYSADGARIVTGSNDRTARIWDADTGAAITLFKSGDGQIDSAAFSPDGTHIATAHQYRVARIWDTRSGAPIAALSGHDGIVDSIDYSPDGARLVTASDDRTARIWDAATARQLTILSGHTAAVYSALYSRDGTRIVTASADKTARIWDSASGTPLVVLDGHRNSVEAAAFSPDGTRVVTASDDRTARLWDARTGEQLMVFSGHDDIVESARFSPDGSRIVTGSDDATARIWDARMPAGLDAQIAWDQAAQFDSMSDLDRTRLGLPADAHAAARAARATGATPCDLAAAAFYDPDRLIPGVAPWKVNPDIAKQACAGETAESAHPARLDYEMGRALLANHDTDGARREFELAVSRAYRSAQVDLANLLWDPPDGKPDASRAAALYEHAWIDGVTTAAFALGQVHEIAGDTTQAWEWYRKGADAREPAALARFAERAEQEALVASDPDRKIALLLDAFRHYAAAAAYAHGEGWPDEAWRRWRHRRATLARLLAREGRMSEAAEAYTAVLAGSAAVPPTLWQSLVAKLHL